MKKYIDTEKLIAEIERLNSLVSYESKDRHDEGLHDAYKAVKNVIASLQQEQPEERPEYGYLSTEYIQGRKSRWNVGDVLAQYICTSNEEGEYPLGKITNVEFDEEDGWVYTFEDESVWDEQSLVEEEFYKKN
jgi:hypothetical protein